MKVKDGDDELIKQAINGSQYAYRAIMAAYGSKLFNFIYRMVKNREDAEEILQDVFINAFKKLDTFNYSSRFSTWLFQIAKNSSLNFLKKRKPDQVELTEEEIRSINKQSYGNDVEEKLDQEIRQKQLIHLLSLLRDQDELLLNLYYTQELSITEIGEILNEKPNNIKIKLHRCRLKFKELLVKFYSIKH